MSSSSLLYSGGNGRNEQMQTLIGDSSAGQNLQQQQQQQQQQQEQQQGQNSGASSGGDGNSSLGQCCLKISVPRMQSMFRLITALNGGLVAMVGVLTVVGWWNTNVCNPSIEGKLCCYNNVSDIALPLYTISFGMLMLIGELRLPGIHDRLKKGCGFIFSYQLRVLFIAFAGITTFAVRCANYQFGAYCIGVFSLLNAFWSCFIISSHPGFVPLTGHEDLDANRMGPSSSLFGSGASNETTARPSQPQPQPQQQRTVYESPQFDDSGRQEESREIMFDETSLSSVSVPIETMPPQRTASNEGSNPFAPDSKPKPASSVPSSASSSGGAVSEANSNPFANVGGSSGGDGNPFGL
eukprot:g3329.t1